MQAIIMQFQGKLQNKLAKMAENLVLDPTLARFGPNLILKIRFVRFTSTRCYKLLQAIVVRNFKEN